jgi:hypothetical protein
MTGLFLTLLATLLVGCGARDQVLVAQLAERQGARPGVLIVAVASGCLAAALAAWGGAQVAGLMPAPARLFLVAVAVGLAGLELLTMRPCAAAAEPTHSLGAFALVIFAIQLTDAARFVVFALAALTQAPLTSAMGGAIGAAAMVAAGWMIAPPVRAPWLPALRRSLGGLLLLVALGTAARAVGWV